VFLGVSAAGALKPRWWRRWRIDPSSSRSPTPTGVRPELAKSVRPDAIIATGRSDYPNQVNNVLCFPFIFRGALDCGATRITEESEDGLREGHRRTGPGGTERRGGHGLRRPGPGVRSRVPDSQALRPRLIGRIAPAVAEAAAASGVAARPIADMEAYRQSLETFVYQSGTIMKPVFDAAKAVPPQPVRVIYAEGEDERVLRAIRVVVEEKLARPVLVGRPWVIEMRIKKFGLNLTPGRDFDIVNPDSDPRYAELSDEYYQLMWRDGVTPTSPRWNCAATPP